MGFVRRKNIVLGKRCKVYSEIEKTNGLKYSRKCGKIKTLGKGA